MRRHSKAAITATALLLAVTGTVTGTVTVAASAADTGTATVSGRVSVPAGQSAAGIVVHARKVIETASGTFWGAAADPVGTATDGSWRVTGLQAGTYRVEFEVPQGRNVLGEWYGDGRWGGEGKDVVVPAGGTVAGVNEELVLGATVTGTVRSASGEPVVSVWVLAHEENRFYGVQEFTRVAGGITDAQGRYTITRLRGVNHRFEVADLHGRGYERSFLGGGNTLAEARDFPLIASRVQGGFDHRFRSGPGSEKPRPPQRIVVRTKAKVIGKAKVGRTLKATRGTYAPSVVRVAFQWQTKKGAKAVAVKGATKAKLRLAKRFKGRQVRVRVTVKAPGHTTVVRTTRWSKKVA